MLLAMVSEDASLAALCAEVARDFPDLVWRLTLEQHRPAESDADLCIWDFRPGLQIPEHVTWADRHFVLLRTRDIAAFRSAHPYAEAAIVYKPVTRAVIHALMAQAIASAGRVPPDDQSLLADRDDLLQCLIQANLHLQQYDTKRTNFFSRAVHDLDAPLTALSGYCGLLLDQDSGFLDDQQKLIIRRMYNSTQRLSRMTRAMFHLSVGRHVGTKPVLRSSDIRECAEQALSEVSQIAQEKQIQIDAELEFSPEPLLLARSQIEQVLIHLLENACKFTPRFGRVELRGYPVFSDRLADNARHLPESEQRSGGTQPPNAYRIDIVDSGPGFPPEHLSSIFEESGSYSGVQDRSCGGLSLAICRLVLTEHHGRIWAENGASGTIFSFVLPLPAGGAARHSDDAGRTGVVELSARSI